MFSALLGQQQGQPVVGSAPGADAAGAAPAAAAADNSAGSLEVSLSCVVLCVLP
jgi:hypothetical protein